MNQPSEKEVPEEDRTDRKFALNSENTAVKGS